MRRITVSKNSASGMTLIEVLVSLAIVFVIFLGLSASGLIVLNENVKNDLRDEAVSVADNAVQTARNTPFATLTNDNVSVLRQVRNVNRSFTVRRTVDNLDTETRQVTILVGWTRVENGVTKPYSHEIVTIVRR